MEKQALTTFLVAFLMLSAGCNRSGDYPPDYKGDQLHFGQGGGFTGAVNAFILLDDGRLFEKGKSDTAHVYQTNWKAAFTRQMFANYTNLGLDSVDHRHPGNLYYFIEFHSPGKTPHVISWGQQGYAPPEGVVSFYQILYKSTRSKS